MVGFCFPKITVVAVWRTDYRKEVRRRESQLETMAGV